MTAQIQGTSLDVEKLSCKLIYDNPFPESKGRCSQFKSPKTVIKARILRNPLPPERHPSCIIRYNSRIYATTKLILGFHVTSEKTKIKIKLKILSFYLYWVKVIFKRILLDCLQLGRLLCFENRTRFFHNAWYRHCFWVTCYVHKNIDSPYVFKF